MGTYQGWVVRREALKSNIRGPGFNRKRCEARLLLIRLETPRVRPQAASLGIRSPPIRSLKRSNQEALFVCRFRRVLLHPGCYFFPNGFERLRRLDLVSLLVDVVHVEWRIGINIKLAKLLASKLMDVPGFEHCKTARPQR